MTVCQVLRNRRNLAALIEENEASAEVITVYADIKATRGVDWINNFWKAHTNNCPYCIASHTASARGKGMTDEQFAELLAVIGLANDTNRVAIGYGVPIDNRFQTR